jgi:hypothetical protein
MHTTMKSAIMLSICLSIVVATMAVRALGEETAMPHDGRHERQRRNHDKRHNHPGSINEIDTSVPIQKNHPRNHTRSIENRTEVVGLIEKTHYRNHTHQNAVLNSTVESELKTKNKEKREKKAKALKTEAMNDGNTTATISLTADNATDIHAHHNHKGRDKHKDNSTADIAFPSNETSAGASETSTVNATTSEAASFATELIPPSSSTRTGGVEADPERPWKEDNELEVVLAAVEADFEAKIQSEELLGQQMTNSATVFSVGITGVVGVVVQTIVHQLIV